MMEYMIGGQTIMAMFEWIRTAYMAFQRIVIQICKQAMTLFLVLFGLIVKFVAWVVGIFTTVIAKVTAAQAAADSMSTAPGASASDVFTACNTFFPLDSVVAWCGIYASVIIALVAYRFIKSWLPTLAG